MKFLHPSVKDGHVSIEGRKPIPIEDGVVECDEVLGHAQGWKPVAEPASKTANDSSPKPIWAVNVENANAMVAAAENVEALAELETTEKSKGGGRKGVLAAIAARLEELSKA